MPLVSHRHEKSHVGPQRSAWLQHCSVAGSSLGVLVSLDFFFFLDLPIFEIMAVFEKQGK